MTQSAEVGIIGPVPPELAPPSLLARQGRKVLLFDPKAPWEKPCGGGLTPDALDEMPELKEIVGHTRPISTTGLELTPQRGFSVDLDRPLRIVAREVHSA